MLGEERNRASGRQRFLEFLRQWSVPGCLAILLAVVDGFKHGWTRSLVSTGALVLVLVQAYVFVDLADVTPPKVWHRKRARNHRERRLLHLSRSDR